jgi:ribosome-dependent ATPase
MRAMHHARSVFKFLFIVAAMVSFLLLWLLSAAAFGVPVKGSFAALSVGTLLSVSAATAMGFLISIFTRTQIAAMLAATVLAVLPTTQS